MLHIFRAEAIFERLNVLIDEHRYHQNEAAPYRPNSNGWAGNEIERLLM